MQDRIDNIANATTGGRALVAEHASYHLGRVYLMGRIAGMREATKMVEAALEEIMSDGGKTSRLGRDLLNAVLDSIIGGLTERTKEIIQAGDSTVVKS